jgi:hypothetical protein
MVEVVLRGLIVKELMENLVNIVDERQALSASMNWKSIINKNEYIQSCVSNKLKDHHSLSSLIEREMSQSDCIKLGTGVEKVIVDIILANNSCLQNIKQKNKKGVKERDHLFKDERNKTIFYAELKSNLNLDTEKCKSTSNKCIQIVEELQEEFTDYKIELSLVGLRYFDNKDIPKIISNKYLSIPDNVIGVNNYLYKLNAFPTFGSEDKYKEFLNYLANSMFK